MGFAFGSYLMCAVGHYLGLKYTYIFSWVKKGVPSVCLSHHFSSFCLPFIQKRKDVAAHKNPEPLLGDMIVANFWPDC